MTYFYSGSTAFNQGKNVKFHGTATFKRSAVDVFESLVDKLKEEYGESVVLSAFNKIDE